MAVDTPARIAILGAGPIGLEAALYARFLGYDVDVYERGRIAENVLQWGHVRMFSPASLSFSPLGVAALKAQSPEMTMPAPDALLTGQEFAATYLLPLAKTDLLSGSLHAETDVLAVGRANLLKQELSDPSTRADEAFRILVRSRRDGQESSHTAEVVIDATGTYGNHRWLGQGGIPAAGEEGADIEYCVPDVAGADRANYQGRHVLLVGAGYSAATTLVALAALADEDRQTRVTWVTRDRRSNDLPMQRIPHDPLCDRDALAQAANSLASRAEGNVTWYSGTAVSAIHRRGSTESEYDVELVGRHARRLSCDRIVGNVGYRPDETFCRELHVQTCYATEGPLRLGAALLQQNGADCLESGVTGFDLLRLPEPNFYILGSKSYGRNSQFLLATGQRQIRDLFSALVGRDELDLYQNVRHLTAS